MIPSPIGVTRTLASATHASDKRPETVGPITIPATKYLVIMGSFTSRATVPLAKPPIPMNAKTRGRFTSLLDCTRPIVSVSSP